MSIGSINDVLSSIELNLIVTEQNVLSYLADFTDDATQTEKALEALRVGVIAIQSASPTLDTAVVQSQFGEMETRMRESISEFQRSVKADLKGYFEENDGIVPRSIDGFLGEQGSLTRTFNTFFNPDDGRLSRLLTGHVGPDSDFGKSLDPANKQGVIAVLEARVQELVEAKLDDVLKEFSLDEDGSAMSRMQTLLHESFAKINRALGESDGQEREARRGHVKGMKFEQQLYDDHFAPLCVQCEDDPNFVARTAGHIENCKTGDLMSTLGDSTGAPGLNIVVEVKDRQVKLRDARKELQDAKANRQAAVGIFVWSRGNEPTEVGDFRRIGDDFYVTVDRDELETGKPLLYFDAAYGIARAMAVAAVRKESADELDLAKIETHIEALGRWAERLSDMSTKARTIQKSGKFIEDCAMEMKDDLDRRVAEVMQLLRA